jgi:hypothetical protein
MQPPPGLVYFGSDLKSLLRGSAYISSAVTSIHGKVNIPILMPGATSGEDYGGIRMFGQVQPLAAQSTFTNEGLRIDNKVGPIVGSMSLCWQIIPDTTRVLPNTAPPPTRFNPTHSQRFVMRDFEMQLGSEGNYIQGFGTGRTYPQFDDSGRIYIAANGRVTAGGGSLAGADATFIFNGYIAPPHTLALNVLVRIINPKPGQVINPPIANRPINVHPIEGSTFMTMLGTSDPDTPLQQHFKNGRLAGATVTERMQVADLVYRADDGGLQSQMEVDDCMNARLHTDLRFDPTNPKTPGTLEAPLPWQTNRTTITFYGPNGNVIGTITPDIEEGFGFATPLVGFPGPALNLVGYGAIRGGTGCFEYARGIMTVNSAITPVPPILVNLYTFQFTG